MSRPWNVVPLSTLPLFPFPLITRVFPIQFSDSPRLSRELRCTGMRVGTARDQTTDLQGPDGSGWLHFLPNATLGPSRWEREQFPKSKISSTYSLPAVCSSDASESIRTWSGRQGASDAPSLRGQRKPDRLERRSMSEAFWARELPTLFSRAPSCDAPKPHGDIHNTKASTPPNLSLCARAYRLSALVEEGCRPNTCAGGSWNAAVGGLVHHRSAREGEKE